MCGVIKSLISCITGRYKRQKLYGEMKVLSGHTVVKIIPAKLEISGPTCSLGGYPYSVDLQVLAKRNRTPLYLLPVPDSIGFDNLGTLLLQAANLYNPKQPAFTAPNIRAMQKRHL